MKIHAKRSFSLLLVLAMVLSLFAGLSLTASAGSVAAVDPTGYTKAEDVKYVKVGSYVCNWGARGEDCTFLSTYAQNYYTGNYAYSVMSKLSGGTQSTAPSSALYSALKNMMNNKSTHTTSYKETNGLYKYTDCLKSDYAHISSFYSGKQLSGTWDSGSTWNKEHTWPNSKIDNNGENDIMMLRPTWVQENSHRGNKAYGESSSTYYFPNQEAGGEYDLRGDCARIVLYVYTRWGVTDKMWGSSGVMESKEVLLKWMKEDPVDTWEMGRNDACQSILGVRNVFVDYPEYAFLLFNESVPTGYTSPSSGSTPVADYKVTAVSNNNAWGTVSVSGNTITAKPATGYYVADAKITSGTGSLSISGNKITVSPKSDCTVTVTFAKVQTVTVSFALPNGVSKDAITGTAGSSVVLSAPSGTPTEGPIDIDYTYTFAGWLDSTLMETTTAPAGLILPGTNYTLSKDITLYPVYALTLETEDDGSGDYVKVKTAPADWSGDYVIVYEGSNYLFDSSLEALDVASNYQAIDAIVDETVAAEDGDPCKIVIEKTNGGYSIKCANGQYIGMESSDNDIVQGDTPLANTISLNEQGGADIVSANCYFRYNKQSGQTRFRYYKASSYANQQPVYLYRKDASATVTYYLTLRPVDPQPCEHRHVSQEHEDATCTQPGYNRVVCDECLEILSETPIPALGHLWDDGVISIPATATTDGLILFTCTRKGCGATRTEIIPASGDEPCPHENTELRNQKAATCTEAGYTGDHYCIDCGELLREGESIPALGHDYKDTVIAPTCTEPGYTIHTCTVCGNSYKNSYVAALGHEYEDGVCIRCGAEDPDVPPVHICPCDDYDDLDKTQWYHEGVDYALDNGLMNGMGERTFNPDGSLTRAMLVTILYRLEKEPSVEGMSNPFTDVPENQWYTDAVIWAADEGIVNGMTETTYAPNDNITREQIATILYRYAGKPAGSGDLNGFADASSVSPYALDAMAWAVGEGIIGGMDGKLAPKDNATRAQIATILYRYLTK